MEKVEGVFYLPTIFFDGSNWADSNYRPENATKVIFNERREPSLVDQKNGTGNGRLGSTKYTNK